MPAPYGSGPAYAEAMCRLQSWGSQVEFVEMEHIIDELFSLVLSDDSNISTSALGTHSAIFFLTQMRCYFCLHRALTNLMAPTELAHKEKQSVAFEGLLEVVAHAFFKLNLDWLDEQAAVVHSVVLPSVEEMLASCCLSCIWLLPHL